MNRHATATKMKVRVRNISCVPSRLSISDSQRTDEDSQCGGSLVRKPLSQARQIGPILMSKNRFHHAAIGSQGGPVCS
jgi:hypothetical protein